MAEMIVKIGRKVDSRNAAEQALPRGRKPAPEPGAQPQGGDLQFVAVVCWNCYAVNMVQASVLQSGLFSCWNCRFPGEF